MPLHSSPFTLHFQKWWPSALTCVVVAYLCLDGDPVGAHYVPLVPGLDKVIHAVMFGGVAGALCFDWQRSHPGRRISRGRMAAYAFAALLFGCIIEWLQDVMGLGRTMDAGDASFDALGCLIAYILAPAVVWRLLHRK